MARIKRTKSTVTAHVEEYLRKSTQEYATLFQGTPVFVEYYSRNRVNTMEDPVLQGSQDVVGTASALAYNKIRGLPLWGLEALSVSMESDDFGPNTEATGSAIFLPGLLRPLPDDHFALTYQNERVLFRVDSVEPDRLMGKQFWKANFHHSRRSWSDIQPNVAADYRAVPSEDPSLDGKWAVMQSLDADLVLQLEEARVRLSQEYSRHYLDPGTGTFTKARQDGLWRGVCPALDRFCQELLPFHVRSQHMAAVATSTPFSYGADQPWELDWRASPFFYILEDQRPDEYTLWHLAESAVGRAAFPWKRLRTDYKYMAFTTENAPEAVLSQDQVWLPVMDAVNETGPWDPTGDLHVLQKIAARLLRGVRRPIGEDEAALLRSYRADPCSLRDYMMLPIAAACLAAQREQMIEEAAPPA